MDLIKCPKGHYYNKEKFPSCPHCANVPAFAGNSAKQSEVETALPSQNAVKHLHQALRKTTGWLVCTEGTMLGESFPIWEGTNHIGRSSAMDITLLYENSVSREDHAGIEYHSDDRSFTLTAPNKDNVVMLNDKIVSKPVCLSDRDTITLGKCRLTFIPFCDKNFNWKN